MKESQKKEVQAFHRELMRSAKYMVEAFDQKAKTVAEADKKLKEAIPDFIFTMTNVDIRAAKFFGEICRLFCDPANEHIALRVRQGEFNLRMAPDGGLTFVPSRSNN
jgi:hypothetical protein